MVNSANAVASSSRSRRPRIADSEEPSPEPEQKPVPDEEDQSINNPNNWTKRNFVDQPVPARVGLERLRSAKSALQTQSSKLLNRLQPFTETAVALESCSPDDELLEKVQIALLHSLQCVDELTLSVEAIDTVIGMVRSAGDAGLEDFEDRYIKTRKEMLKEYNEKSERTKFKDNTTFRAFREAIWEINHEDEACPPMSRWLQGGDGDESDDEPEVGGQTQTYRCPITMQTYVDASRSKACGHHYSHAAIMDYIRQGAAGRRGGASCPMFGCSAKLTKEMIERDPEMQQRADKASARQAARRAEEEENDDSMVL